MTSLTEITCLSHEFGTWPYVKGGGGNSSVKDAQTCWVKPSGTTLSSITESAFVAMDREKLALLYDVKPPVIPAERETLVLEAMNNAKRDLISGRPSVEAPLHESIKAKYVVHTHPELVNGLTCAKDAKERCLELFPEAMWVDYIDPGYTLCMVVRQMLFDFEAKNGQQPNLIFLKNHGIFVSGETPEDIRNSYKYVIDKLKFTYEASNVSIEFSRKQIEDDARAVAAKQLIQKEYPQDDICIEACSSFTLAEDAITPDHSVYSKSFFFTGQPKTALLNSFAEKYGYLPCVIAYDGMVFGIGATKTKAALALELAVDGSCILQLSKAFGGINYMAEKSRLFIENWEVESYRSKQL